MARQRASQSMWIGPHRDESLDGMFEHMAEAAASALDAEVSVASKDEQAVVGLPLPALCLRYLMQSTVWPLGRSFQITGEEGTCKSAFLLEIMRWHHVYGGGSVFIENELKDSPAFRRAILQHNPRWLARHEMVRTHSLQQWQRALETFVSIGRRLMDDPNGPGHTVPICYGIDSLTATSPESVIDQIRQDGYASLGYPIMARLISEFMRTMPDRIRNYPLSIVGTNHLKPGTDNMGRPTEHIPGGKSIKFMETYEFTMKRAPNCDIDRLDYGGLRLIMRSRKNSLGPSRREIQAELLWWWAPDEQGNPRQLAVWDWDTATIEMILALERKKEIYNAIMEICPIKVQSKRERKATSPILGIHEPTEFRAVGAALERRPDLLVQMYPILGIHQHREFTPGVDYRDTLRLAAEDAKRARAAQGSQVEELPEVPVDPLAVEDAEDTEE